MKKGLFKLMMLGAMVICMLSVAGATNSNTELETCDVENVESNWFF